MNPLAKSLVEVSWEVANKVGGIHTVISTHTKHLQEVYDTYLCIGPLRNQTSEVFIQQEVPQAFAALTDTLEKHNISYAFGKWNVSGQPHTLLLDARNAHIDTNWLKGQLWELFGVDSLHARYDFDEPLKFSYAVALVLKEYYQKQSRVVAHLHEWMTGLAGLCLRVLDSACPWVFTTHATMLGRTISATHDKSINEVLNTHQPTQLAKQLGMSEKHTTELACLTHAYASTTVSDVTADEIKKIFDTTVDVVTYNGIMPQEQINQVSAKNDLLRVASAQIGSCISKDTTLLFTSGRFEVKNKGLDVFCAALKQLNEYLKKHHPNKQVIAFFWILFGDYGITNETAHNNKRLRTQPGCDTSKELMSTNGVCTHYVDDNELLSLFDTYNLEADATRPVSVVWSPSYLEGADGLYDRTYDELVAACDAGVFVSYYEPWGYTPVEAARLNVTPITSDLAGFGVYARQHELSGAWVLKRKHSSFDESVNQLTDMLISVVKQSTASTKELQEVIQAVDWKNFIKHYIHAHNIAYEK